ncbi:MAG: response regulator [Desulfuromonas sp.]|nr:response regulator [Desulfuromonas sp.]
MKGRSISILCVDDYPMNLDLLEAMFVGEDFTIVRAQNGLQALDIIRKTRIDLVLLDVMMPGMDGFEVCRRIKADPVSQNIPVVMITAYTDKESRIKGITAGAEDFLSKPFDRAEVMARVNMLLKVKTLNDQLKYAYSNITNLISFGEEIISTFDPLHFDFIQTVTGIVNQIIATAEHIDDKPQRILVHFPELGASGTWFSFAYQADTLVKTILLPDIGTELNVPKHGSSYNFFNKTDLDRAEIAPFIKRVSQDLELPNNLVCCLNRQLSICALNYGRPVSDFDAEVINSVVAQGLFLRSLSRQITDTEDAFSYMLHALARASECNDEDTGNHILRVGHYCALLAVCRTFRT